MGSASRGLLFALFGALVLTPDALFLRWSDMSAFQMLGWRGLCMGTVFWGSWLLLSRTRGDDLKALMRPIAVMVVACHALNAAVFPIGIEAAPVAAVLLGMATVPVWSALLAWVIYREHTSLATWLAMAGTVTGLLIAVSEPGSLLDPDAAFGVLCGLGVAAMLAVNFVTLRHHPGIPILPAIGTGALLAGMAGVMVAGPSTMTDGVLWAILPTGLVFLPLSFFTLSYASRLTHAANVSLLLLLETILAPLWVWMGTGEAPTQQMLWGGALVILTLSLYLASIRPASAASRAPSTKAGR